MNTIPEKFLNKKSEGAGLEQVMSQITEIQEILPADESKLDVSKFSDKTRKFLLIAAVAISTTFAALIPKESGAQTYQPQPSVFGSNIPTTTVNIYNNGPQGGYNGPTYNEQRDHQKVEAAANIFYQIFRFIGHNKIDKKHHPKQPPQQPTNTYTGPR